MPRDPELVSGWRHALDRLTGAPDDLGGDPAFYDRLVALTVVRQAVKRRLLPVERALALLPVSDRMLACGPVDWQAVPAGDALPGRRLLVIELDGQSDAQVAEAIGVLVGRETPGHR